jgi:hypothetical protein
MAMCTTTWPATSLVPYDVIVAHARRLGLGFIATRGWFCYQRQCPAVIGRTIVYLPIGQLSPVSLKKIRVVHVLDGYDKREIAKEYLW